MNIAERRLPQDGRIRLILGARRMDIRVSTIPQTGRGLKGERGTCRGSTRPFRRD